jgi:hypothetical protein
MGSQSGGLVKDWAGVSDEVVTVHNSGPKATLAPHAEGRCQSAKRSA